jgi:hypothetical protein
MVSEHRFVNSEFRLIRTRHLEHFAQLLASFLCDRLLEQRIQFSFETVFSHESKLAFMQRARDAGFKVSRASAGSLEEDPATAPAGM